jgi:alkanesulfonate monooxygenase SsuD/methylene tetrahydromethanopterin reductase-like flavin-dependent oxidoreductase (luciferase family)
MRFGLRYDMRAPELGPDSPTATALYKCAIDQAAWADEHGFGAVYLAEHHGAEDGYLPSPITLAAAIAARTHALELHFSALVVPVHDTIRLAEELTVLDLIAGPHRVQIYAGMGYRPHEYAMFGIDFDRRVEVYEAALAVLQEAWNGQPVERNGATFRVTPRPATPGGPRLLVAGNAKPSARRAARLGLGYRPATEELYNYYLEQAALANLPQPEPFPRHGPGFVYVTEDPERDWVRLAPYIRHASNLYAQWANERDGVNTSAGYWRSHDDLADLKDDPAMWVITPQECVQRCTERGADWELRFHALLGGMPVDLSWASLELFAAKVLPELHSIDGAAATAQGHVSTA